MVDDAAPLGDGRFGSTDVHAAVLGHRIDVDDLAAEPFGDIEAQRRLAARGGPDDRDRHRRFDDPPLMSGKSVSRASRMRRGTRRRTVLRHSPDVR